MKLKLSVLILVLSFILSACGSNAPSATISANSSNNSAIPSAKPSVRVDYNNDDDYEFDEYEEEEFSNYPLLLEVLERAWEFGYLTAFGHDWIMDIYSENEGYDYIRYDLEFYGDKRDQVFLKVNKENETDAGRSWDNPQIREGELILTILDMAYYHGYISPSGHDWLLDAFRENESCGYWKYDLEFYGDEEDTIFYYGYELGD